MHSADFLGRELRRRRSRAGAAVIELAGALETIPGVVARRRKAENAQHHCELQSRSRSGDCGQDLGFCGAFWNAGLVQAHSGEAEQHEEKPRDRAEYLVALAQADDLRLKLNRILGHHVQCHDRARPAAKPTRRGRPGHAHPLEQPRATFFADQLL